ncbi:MAG: sugar phosphate isomerase/epimerase [Victivallaceae bacterium]|nr:sugar phosphate isomerase/epimerase [Victivallaceae bacterium]
MQNYEKKNTLILQKFLEFKKTNPKSLEQKLNLSWSNWGFGIEPLCISVTRLLKNNIQFIELHGNHYGTDLGYKPKEILKLLGDNNIKVSGICGMFSPDNDLSSNRPIARQNAIDYIKREIDFADAMPLLNL